MMVSWLQHLTAPYRFAKRSYAQCGEDLILEFLFAGLGKSTGTFLDIGAHHPFYLNNTFLLYKRRWRGTNIDPLGENIEKFKSVRPRDLNLCCGIGDSTLVRDLYVFEPKSLSTFDPDTARRYELQGHRIGEVRKVQILAVGDFVERNGLRGPLDLLSIDIEGGELNVITGLLERNVVPSVIVCETVIYAARLTEARKDPRIVQEICELGYMAFADTFVNTVFVAKDLWEGRR